MQLNFIITGYWKTDKPVMRSKVAVVRSYRTLQQINCSFINTLQLSFQKKNIIIR